MSGTTHPHTSTLESSKTHFMLDRTIKFDQPHCSPFCLSKLTCRVTSSMGAKLHHQADFISSLVTVFGKYEHCYSCMIRTEAKCFSVFVQYNSLKCTGCSQVNNLPHNVTVP